MSPYTYPLFCGGFGAGKSLAMSVRIMMDINLADGIKIGAYAPTYDLLRLITLPYVCELLEESGERFNLNKSENIFHLSDKRQIICRSMDNPARIVGYETLRAHADELDTLRLIQAREAWNKIIARNRQKIIVHPTDYPDHEIVFDKSSDEYNLKNKVSAYTTPEGFNFAHERWVDKKNKNYKLYKAPTYSNKFLPPDYIDNLRSSYPAQLIDAYIEGDFVNLTSGRVYKKYDRVLNASEEGVNGNEPLDIGMDFNIEHGAASINVTRGYSDHAVDEVFDSYDTDDTIRVIKERYPDNPIRVYPDASGKKRASGASNGVDTKGKATATDLAKLKSAGFHIIVNHHNPLIKDRVAAVNARICNGKFERNYFVNEKKCPNHVNTLEKQVYMNGVPDKSTGLDHIGDSLGYFLCKKHSIVKNTAGYGR